MAGASLLALIDDIATLLDDISVLSKVAVQKTSGVLGDDLALNAQQVTGLTPDRELPVVWKVGLGSAVNKAILVPAALALSFFLPIAITPLLMFGGLYLCFEGVEKLLHKFLHPHEEDENEHEERKAACLNPQTDMVAFEKERIRGAVRTDFVLSAEIIVITLGSLKDVPFLQQVIVLTIVSVIMTIGVYGLVGVIVKLDDLGLRLLKSSRAFWKRIGQAILAFAPLLLKFLSVAGTIAMFMVGGGIIAHGSEHVHHAIEHAAETAGHVEVVGGLLEMSVWMIANTLVGVLSGAAAVAVVLTLKKLSRVFGLSKK
ncbi:MAG: DUF808 domain-containing protein [Pirellulales bacterium]